MQKIGFVFSLTIVGTFFLSGCISNVTGDSLKYGKEELVAYEQLMDELMDSAGYEVIDTVKQVFYLFDSLAEVDNRSVDGEFLKIELDKKIFSMQDLNNSSYYKYLRATDTLKVNKGEYFTGHWLTISRVCFNAEMDKGFLYFKTWCGNLCSQTDTYEIEKIEGTWRIKKRYRGSIS